ncbi:hypothetical protein [Pseudactinotalea terrae]|uniref:hypothetical protein n=1 Tax=Pseudactinotalea terrae TaxID=1743262 RepID=UPI0012E1FA2A|nr:hypothetical protein [Pseudactinotalea terrae]
MDQSLTRLRPSDRHGTWVLATASGTRYELTHNEHGCTVSRLPGQTEESANLRRDREPIRLLGVNTVDEQRTVTVGELRVGQRAVLLLEPLAADAVYTQRVTTPVVAITKQKAVVGQG